MAEQCQTSCGCESRLIFACSGGADVGAISDQAARRLTVGGVGKMYCLAGIGGRVEGIMKTTREATKILVIDGCPINCAKKCLEQAGIENFLHLQLADLGFEKGVSPCVSENIEKVVEKAKQLI